jgi:hypothetical protein
MFKKSICIYIYIYTHTHTHTYTIIYKKPRIISIVILWTVVCCISVDWKACQKMTDNDVQTSNVSILSYLHGCYLDYSQLDCISNLKNVWMTLTEICGEDTWLLHSSRWAPWAKSITGRGGWETLDGGTRAWKVLGSKFNQGGAVGWSVLPIQWQETQFIRDLLLL